jgi:hypothetical protein
MVSGSRVDELLHAPLPRCTAVTGADSALRQLFNAIFGWNNTATLGSVLIYVFYWLAVAAGRAALAVNPRSARTGLCASKLVSKAARGA